MSLFKRALSWFGLRGRELPLDELEDRTTGIHRPLMQLSPHREDRWTLADSFEGTLILGANGSGKTTSSGAQIATAMLQSQAGVLATTTKVGEADRWVAMARATGRERDLILFRPGSGWRFNVLQYECEHGIGGSGLTDNLASLVTHLVEAGRPGNGQTATERFFQASVHVMARYAIELIRLADARIDLPTITQVIRTAPQDYDQIASPSWQQGSRCLQLVGAARQRVTDENDLHELRGCEDYFMRELPGMDPRTRSNVVQTFVATADGFCHGIFHELFSRDTTFTPDMVLDGKVVILDFPIKRFGETARLAQILIKEAWQRCVERRPVSEHTRPVLCFIDEAQNFVTPRDHLFQATARSCRAATVLLTQSMSGLISQLGGGDGRANAEALASVLGNKIIHASGDPETCQFGERLFAQHWTYRSQTSLNPPQKDKTDSNTGLTSGGSRVTSSASPSLEARVLAGEFTTLATGGSRHGFKCEAYFFQAGRSWAASNSNALRVTFQQMI
ncbi:MAG: hypothetical protein AAF711_01130 [Planctomycetota bacterium]